MSKNRHQSKLIMILGLLVVVLLANGYLVKPLKKEVDSKTYDLDTLIQERTQLENNLNAKEKIEDLLTFANTRVMVLGVALPSVVNQEEIIKYHTGLVEEHNIDSSNETYKLNEVVVQADPNVPSIPYVLNAFDKLLTGEPDLAKEIPPYIVDEEKNKRVPIGDLTINLSFNAKYTDLKALLIALESGKHNAIIRNINLSKEVDTLEKVSGSLTIAYPYYYEGEELEELEWNLLAEDYGRMNPFLEKVKKQVLKDNTNVYDPTTKDFLLSMSSIVSDGPTIGFQKSGSRQSVLYDDVNDRTPVDLWITKDDKGYWYKYHVGNQSYPIDGSLLRFEPQGDNIVIVANSATRGDQDYSGCLMNIYNTTGLSVEIHTYREKNKNPRLKIGAAEGNFVVYNH